MWLLSVFTLPAASRQWCNLRKHGNLAEQVCMIDPEQSLHANPLMLVSSAVATHISANTHCGSLSDHALCQGMLKRCTDSEASC